MARPDEHSVANRIGDQIHAAHYECPEKELTEGSVGLHDPAQGRPIDFEQLTRLTRLAPHQAAAPRELIDFAGKRPLAENSEHGRVPIRNTDDFDAAAEHDKDTMAIVAQVEKNFTGLRSEPRAE